MLKSLLYGAAIVLLCLLFFWWGPLQHAVQAIAAQGATENTLYTLLMVPVGVVAIVAIRLIVGLETFGLFAPLILAFAFYRMSPLIGAALFLVLLLAITPVGYLLNRFALLSSARTGVLLMLSALLLIFALAYVPFLSERLTLVDLGLPIVAISGMMDRFVSAQMDQSPHEAIKLSFNTLAVSVLVAVLVVGNTYLRNIVHASPDLLWFCVPLCLLIGRYTGLRVNEMWRFRELAKDR